MTIQFPDPWFKRKHHKRRVLQPALLLSLAAALAPGRQLFLQSDVPAVIEPMLALVEASGCFEAPTAERRPWQLENPLAVPTERENQVLSEGLPVYRAFFVRNAAALPNLAQLEEMARQVDNPGETRAVAVTVP